MIALGPQIIFDSICNPVGTNNAPLFVGWSVGQRKAVASELAEQFGTDAADIDEVLGELIETGLLTNKTQVPKWYSGQDEEHLGITHEGWQKWSYFWDGYVNDWDLGSIEEWIVNGIKETIESDCKEIFVLKPTSKPRHKWRSNTEPWCPPNDN